MSEFNNINILIVDDDDLIREELEELFSREGYKTAGAGTVKLAERKIRKIFYNVVLIDLRLPDGSGLELLKKIKKINNHTKAVIFTGFANLTTSISALNEQAFAYIEKPVDIDTLKQTVKKALRSQKISMDTENQLNRLKDLNLKDTNTELYNYRYLMERIISEVKGAKRYMLPFSVIMIDIDSFKAVNDMYGYEYGDFILKQFARYLKSFVRGSDTIARYGQDEFVILLPDTMVEGAVIFAEILLDGVRKHVFDPEGKKIKINISAGISGFPHNGGDVNMPSQLLSLADKALAAAKQMGGDRLSVYKAANKKKSGVVKQAYDTEEAVRLKNRIGKIVNKSQEQVLEELYSIAGTKKVRGGYSKADIEDKINIINEIGRKFNQSGKELENLSYSAALYDIGKSGIPDIILNKTKKLTKKEYEIIKSHSRISADMIGYVPSLKDLVPIILFHHERFDGSGYPSGLKFKEIPLGARIIAVTDAYKSLVSDTPYRKAYTKKEALCIIEHQAGKQFDPEVVEVFLEVVDKSQ
jgi:diguanylate cyclase (GGDEF)-like protein